MEVGTTAVIDDEARPRTRHLLRLAWDAYLRRAQRYQNTLILTLVYFAVVGPTVLPSQLFRVEMLGASKEGSSFWTRRERRRVGMDELRRQF